ncbi:MAG: diadenylate cyclase CdaA [bacterium]|nr:diadenylate cyclase CdaA [bacterium]
MSLIKITVLDLIDIVLVAVIVYQALRFLKGTRAVQMFIGIFLIFLLTFIADILNLRGLTWILNGLKSIWIIFFIVVFQPEIRRVLTVLGKSKFVRYFIREERKTYIDEIVKSVQKLVDRGLGGLIVLEGDVGLKHFYESGTVLNSSINSDLVVSIFSPKSPLHDGALIIKDERMVAASAILPLSENPIQGVTLGTRHRAALGLSEESDAFVIVISEERRMISIAEKGVLKRDVDSSTLEKEISRFYL